ncbi:MAG: hypothetical protein OHK0019_38360 [Saprospiraceae bacterium]
MKPSLLLFFSVCICFTAQSQCPVPAVLASQADVDNFPIAWPGCVNPTGRFVIGADPTVPLPHPVSDIDDLTPLLQLTGFGNHTYIYNNPNLTSLSGLDNVTQVLGDFTIQKNNGLTDLTGLGSLTYIQDLFKIENNDNLVSLEGLEGGFTALESLVLIENNNLTDLGTVYDNLTTVDQYVYIQDNGSLASFNTMNNLTSIGQYLNFENHPSLSTLSGFQSLVSVGLQGTGWDVEILDCPILTTLDNFSSLSQIGKNLEISNTGISSLDFPSLNSIGGQLIIDFNSSLTSIIGLGDFTVTGPVTILENTLLSECEAQGICDYLEILANPATIGQNDPGCNNRNQIELACALLPVELLFFNGTEQNGEVLLRWQTASEENNDYFQMEHSTDGSHFQPIGKVAGRGTTTVPHKYSFRHTRPTAGANYYRFKQVDFDGKFSYSPIVHVEIGAGAIVEVFPNPTTSLAVLKGDLAEGTARLLDINGRPLIEKQLPNGRTFDLSPFPAGIYLLEVIIGNEKIVKRVVKE